MARAVRCPTCGTLIDLADELVGQKVRCSACQHVFTVGVPGATGAAAVGDTTTPAGDVRPGFGRGPAAVAAILVACGTVGLVIVGGIATALRVQRALYPLRVTSRRDVCASNLRGIGQAIFIYADANSGWFPHAGGRAGSVPYPVGAFVSQPPGDNQSSTSAALFLLIRNAQCTPKQFVCPCSGDTPDPLTQGAAAAFDFSGPQHLSYGYHWGHGPGIARLNTYLHPAFPIMADRGPYIADSALAASNGGSTAADLSRNGNSPNHRREGQNVLFADGHAEWTKRPNVGMDGDNVFTFGPSAPTGPPGTAPRIGQSIGLASTTDTCLVP